MKRHKKDDSKFLFYFKKNCKLYRKLFTTTAPTKGARVEDAIKRLNVFYESAGNVRDNLNPKITVNDYWKRFKEDKEWSKEHNYAMTLKYDKYIKKFIGNKSISAVTKANVDDIMLNVKHMSKRTQKGNLEILEPLFKRAIRDGLREDMPIDDDNKVQRNFAKEKKIIMNPKDKFIAIYNAIQDVKDLKIKTAFMFGFNGRRLQEVLKMKWDHVDFNSHSYSIPAENSKVDADMVFALNSDLIVLLRALYDTRDSEYIFSSNRDSSIPMTRVNHHYDDIRTVSGIKEFTFHWMRNLLVSTLADNGVAIADLSAILGHQDDATIKKYLSLQRENASNRAHNAMNEILAMPSQKAKLPIRSMDEVGKG